MTALKAVGFIVRLLGTAFIGFSLLHRIHLSKYSSFALDNALIGVLIALGTIFFFWTLYIDVQRFEKERRKYLLIPIVATVLFATGSLVLKQQIDQNFEKPTLLMAHHEGGTNGVSIDFKKDGTFILYNAAFDYKEYQYGSFTIENELISLTPVKDLPALESKALVIRELSNETSPMKMMYQIDSKGKVYEKTVAFRIVEDYRYGK